jgi:hypothetical protein
MCVHPQNAILHLKIWKITHFREKENRKRKMPESVCLTGKNIHIINKSLPGNLYLSLIRWKDYHNFLIIIDFKSFIIFK